MKIFLKKIKNKIKFARNKIRVFLAIWGVNFYGKKVLSGQKGNNLIAESIARETPFMAARIGSSELLVISFYLLQRKKLKIPYTEALRHEICNFSGVFPVDDESLDRFCETYLDGINQTDLMAVWFHKNEDYVCRNFFPKARLTLLAGLEPYYYKNPWSAQLAGKKVLVVHPFAKTIESQYKNNREKIFPNPAVLPEFNLQTVRAVQGLVGEKPEFDSWFAALENMKKEIASKDFDIAIIGAGAYGLPLAAFVKSLGKQAIHLGGATQIFFGIKGRRWDAYKVIFGFYNECWVRPLPDETPANSIKMENGCYW
jgi:hypothetical protein